jgi:hypothetical protein
MKAFQKPAMGKQRVSNLASKEGLRAEKALKMAVAGVIEEHRRLGLPIAVMRNGKAVFVSVDKKVSAVRETKASYRTKR